MSGLGYRQKAALTVLNNSGRALATGYIARVAQIDEPNTAYIALKGLEARGLARHVGHGRWAAA